MLRVWKRGSTGLDWGQSGLILQNKYTCVIFPPGIESLMFSRVGARCIRLRIHRVRRSFHAGYETMPLFDIETDSALLE